MMMMIMMLLFQEKVYLYWLFQQLVMFDNRTSICLIDVLEKNDQVNAMYIYTLAFEQEIGTKRVVRILLCVL